MKFAACASAVVLGVVLAPAALAQGTIETEKAPATDSEGVDPNQKAETEAGEKTAGGETTVGGGPKHSMLHEEWRKWLVDLKTAPPGFIPVPPRDKEPEPRDPLECAHVVSMYQDDPDRLNEHSGTMKEHMIACQPAE